MSNDEIDKLSYMALFRLVFGKKDGQSLSDFAAECAPLKDDTKFIAEVREHAKGN